MIIEKAAAFLRQDPIHISQHARVADAEEEIQKFRTKMVCTRVLGSFSIYIPVNDPIWINYFIKSRPKKKKKKNTNFNRDDTMQIIR